MQQEREVIVNSKITSQVINIHVFRGYDIGSDYFLVCVKVQIFTRGRKQFKERIKRDQKYKVYDGNQYKKEYKFQQKKTTMNTRENENV